MTDLLFPMEVPDSFELYSIRQVQYTTQAPQGDFFLVRVGKSFVLAPINVPSPYYKHVRNFLWRHWVFMKVECRFDLDLAPGLRALLQRYIAYMDAIIEGLFMTARVKAGNDEMFRSAIFDLYLVVEYYVGRHEYDVCDAWRLQHPEVILECINVENIDWEEHYRLQDESNPLWSGSEYSFDITKVPEESWQVLADLVAGYFNYTNPKPKVMRRKRKISEAGISQTKSKRSSKV